MREQHQTVIRDIPPPPPTPIRLHLAFGLRLRSARCVMSQFISKLASNLAITCLAYHSVQSVDSFRMAPHTCQDYLEISESARYIRATSCTLWRKVLLNGGSIIEMYLTYVDLSEPETFSPLLSYVCLNMHAISCNSRFVIMDTDRGGEKGWKKKRKTSSVSIATESSLVLPKMV